MRGGVFPVMTQATCFRAATCAVNMPGKLCEIVSTEKQETMPMLNRLVGSVAVLTLGVALSLALPPQRAIAEEAPAKAAEATSGKPITIVLLDVLLQNDNEGLDPTSADERARQVKVGEEFKRMLEASGHYKFVPVTDDIKKKMATAQHIGQCYTIC